MISQTIRTFVQRELPTCIKNLIAHYRSTLFTAFKRFCVLFIDVRHDLMRKLVFLLKVICFYSYFRFLWLLHVPNEHK